MSTKTTMPTVEELMKFLEVRKEQERKNEEKRQCLLAGLEYKEERRAEQGAGARRSERSVAPSKKYGEPYSLENAKSRTLQSRSTSKKIIPREVVTEMCRRAISAFRKTENEAEVEKDAEPKQAEKENEAVEEPVKSRKSERSRRARKPCDYAP